MEPSTTILISFKCSNCIVLHFVISTFSIIILIKIKILCKQCCFHKGHSMKYKYIIGTLLNKVV